jgi:hypothetical protein
MILEILTALDSRDVWARRHLVENENAEMKCATVFVLLLKLLGENAAFKLALTSVHVFTLTSARSAASASDSAPHKFYAHVVVYYE